MSSDPVCHLENIREFLNNYCPMLSKSDLSQIDAIVEKRLKPIKKDLRYLKKTVDLIVKNYDEADVKLERVKRIEHHLALPIEN